MRIAPESKQGGTLGFRVRLRTPQKGKRGGVRLRIAPESMQGRTLGFRVRLRTPQRSKQVGGSAAYRARAHARQHLRV